MTSPKAPPDSAGPTSTSRAPALLFALAETVDEPRQPS